jgi:hypothetical protein
MPRVDPLQFPTIRQASQINDQVVNLRLNEYEVNSKYTLFMDFKQVWLSVKADGVLSDGSAVKARVKLNPSMVTVASSSIFRFGRGH